MRSSYPPSGWALAGLLAGLLMLGCSPAPSTAPAAGKPHAAAPHGAATPAGAIQDPIAHLRHNALADVARSTLPPALHARVEAGWRSGDARWPLSELPLDDSLPGLLQALTEKDAERTLQARHRQQLAGQTRALQEAARGLGLFGKQYLAREGEYNAQQRQHYVQLIEAVSDWAQHAPLGDPARGRESVHLLVAGAGRTGLHGNEDFTRLGMDASLKALVPLYIAAKQVLGLYGLGVDAALASVRAETVKQAGDRASVRVRYTLADDDIETVVEAVKVEGRWYLTDYLKAAEASLGPPKPTPPVTEPARPAGR